MEYHFEEIQQLKFIVYDIDDKKRVDDISKQELIGETECTLAEIITAGQRYDRKLRCKGKVVDVRFHFVISLLLPKLIICVCTLLS